MIKKLKTLILSLSLLFSFSVPLAVSSVAFAQTQAQCTGGATQNCVSQNDINTKLKCGSNIDLSSATTKDNCISGTADSGHSISDILKTVINVLSVLVGAIAVIMIIIGGFRYVTSAGNDSNTAAARKTILYALVGLVLVALAQVIVHFVLNNIA